MDKTLGEDVEGVNEGALGIMKESLYGYHRVSQGLRNIIRISIRHSTVPIELSKSPSHRKKYREAAKS
jgi:hypothetical protein